MLKIYPLNFQHTNRGYIEKTLNKIAIPITRLTASIHFMMVILRSILSK